MNTEILQNISIIIASITAIYGIFSWRREHIGKRKIDIAEEVLCSIYEIKDAIKYIRNPVGTVGEGSKRDKSENETSDQSWALDQANVVFERYKENQDIFNKFFKLKYRYIANFEKDSEEPFLIVRKTINKIFFAARRLGNHYWLSQDRRRMSDAQMDKHIQDQQKYEDVFWERDEMDEINREIDKAVAIIENLCKSANTIGLKNYLMRMKT